MSTPRRADARSVLPSGPARALLLDAPTWAPGLQLAGWELVDRAPDVAVASPARLAEALACGAGAVLVEGRVGARAGWTAQRWSTVLRREEPLALAPAGDAGCLRLALRAWTPSGPARTAVQRALLAVPRGTGLPTTTVLTRGPGALDALSATALALGAPAGLRPVLLVGGGSERRRVTALLLPPGATRPSHVLKAERYPSGENRGLLEQAVSARVRALALPGAAVPEVLGTTTEGPDGGTASLERAASGRPLDGLLRTGGGRPALDRLADWLLALAAATRSTAPADDLRPGLAASWSDDVVEPVLAAVAGLPTVMAHGDLVEGGNVLVDGDALAVLDWETARQAPPLLDLLPSYAVGLALGRVGAQPAAVAAEVVRCALGRSPDSGALAARVHELRRVLDLPDGAVGPLALLAWLWHGAQPAVHRAALRDSGLPADAWDSTRERIARAWQTTDGLQLSWSALPG